MHNCDIKLRHVELDKVLATFFRLIPTPCILYFYIAKSMVLWACHETIKPVVFFFEISVLLGVDIYT